MTADGRELVLQGHHDPGTGNRPPLPRQRAIDRHRFTEVFTNNSAGPLNLNVGIFINPGGNGDWQAMLSESGQVNPAALGTQETGILLWVPVQNGTISLALYLAGQKGTVRPTIQQFGNNRQANFTYSFALAPRQTAALIYGAIQTRLGSQPDAQAVAGRV